MTSSAQNEKPETMSTAIGESISALLDDQGDELDLRRVLRESEQSENVRATWHRYHMASAVMKNESSPLMGVDLSAHIRAEIDLEPAHALSSPSAKRRWVDIMAKGSIAATVAFGLLVGVQQYSGFGAGNSVTDGALAELEPFVAPDLNSAVVPAGFDTPTLSARTVSTAHTAQQPSLPRGAITQALPTTGSKSAQIVEDAELQAHLDRLMMIHAGQVSDNSDLGVISFARLTDLNAVSAPTIAEGEASVVESQTLVPRDSE
ncbi:sigma-E factor negative regulatory protein [Teredinibacter purpureus]|uniref:sigma-E factor negative regulatory protein n=1 Tax=Teredinibacter purpureus TaxID=2731756 RepID=UPI0005F77D17|nr:sigma-E factor negative regulatory protein [Teredinibacter purpureus]